MMFISEAFCQQNIEGTWRLENRETITFLPVGNTNEGYLYIYGQHAYWVKRNGNQLSYVSRENRIVRANYKVIGDKLHCEGSCVNGFPAVKLPGYFKPQNVRSIPLDNGSFFDFSTDKYFAGSFFDLTSKSVLPFYINPLFIQRKKIDSIDFTLADVVMNDSLVTHEYDEVKVSVDFKNGYTTKMILKRGKSNSITWNYYYSKNNKLDSISIPGGVLKFDSEGWVRDNFGYKVWPNAERPIFWEYKDGLPSLLAQTFGGNYTTVLSDFIYNSSRQLTEIAVHDISAGGCYNKKFLLDYDKEGILKKITHARIENTFKKKSSETLEDNDGNKYQTVQIGKQIWMAENLKTTRLNNGDTIPMITENAVWEKLVTPALSKNASSTDSTNKNGFLYNWYTVETNKLCPEGWHVPSLEDYTILTNFLCGVHFAGIRLKAGNNSWEESYHNGVNEVGFAALPSGMRASRGYYWGNYKAGYWWSTTENDTEKIAYRFELSYSSGSSNLGLGYKNDGYSVRCLKDL